MEDDNQLTIPEFYRNKNIFITGGTGFIGKVLVEKLLRSCPDLNAIYLLIRCKKGKTPEERIQSITDIPLFDLVRRTNPEALKKIHPIAGDVRQLQLGLSDSDQEFLINEIDIIYHGAASVRFDDPLTDAILINTRSTRELMNLALKMAHLHVFVHVSTTYCNCDRKIIGEQLYPAYADWRKTIDIVERVDKQTLNIMTKKYINPMPNTYTFAKQLAEHVAYDLGHNKIPLVVFRPSIVISTAKEPMPGWIDNFNGPVGLLVASGKGILRSTYTDPDIIADYVPVDIIAKALIISSWQKATTKDPEERLLSSFYNGSNNSKTPVTFQELIDIGKDMCAEMPLNNVLWYPGGSITKCYYYHLLRVIFYHLLPAIVIDAILKFSGRPPMLLKIQRRIYTANMAVHYFLRRQWVFINDKVFKLEDMLLPGDVVDFSYYKDIGVLEYFSNANKGCRKYLLKESDESLPLARRNFQIMWILYNLSNFLWYLGVFWLVFYKIDLISILCNKYNAMYWYLTTE